MLNSYARHCKDPPEPCSERNELSATERPSSRASVRTTFPLFSRVFILLLDNKPPCQYCTVRSVRYGKLRDHKMRKSASEENMRRARGKETIHTPRWRLDGHYPSPHACALRTGSFGAQPFAYILSFSYMRLRFGFANDAVDVLMTHIYPLPEHAKDMQFKERGQFYK